MADDAPSQRFVPGAPPPPLLSKSQRKKRKSAIKPKPAEAPSVDSVSVIPDAQSVPVIEKAPEATDNEKDPVAEPLAVAPESTQEITQEKVKKSSPVVELLNKKIKVQNKKLARLAVYSSKPASELNEDQQRSIASLPSIQGAVRELEETRKAIEALELEEEKERAKQRVEEERAISERITHALADAKDSHQQRMSDILTLLRLSSLLSTSDPTTFILNINEKERHALFVTSETLLGPESPQKDMTLGGLFLGEGDVDGMTYTRLLEIIDAFRNPPVERELTPPPEEAVSDKEVVEQSTESVVAIEVLPVIADGAVTTSGGFHFMQESELEGASFEHGAEWVEKPQAATDRMVNTSGGEASQPLAVIDTRISHDVNGVTRHIEEPPLSAVSATLDWAADDGDGLPSINSLHAKFGTSGAGTPENSSQDAVPVTEANKASSQSEGEWNTQKNSWNTDTTPTVNGNVGDTADSWAAAPGNVQEDEEGFVKAKGSRGKQFDNRPEFQRGRGRSGFRGDRGGEYRGGYRGRGGGDSFGSGWRGADGEFRGRGGYRGGRGGEFRGGEFRGRGGRGGEFRGRGRGNRGGRGGFEGNGDGERIPQS